MLIALYICLSYVPDEFLLFLTVSNTGSAFGKLRAMKSTEKLYLESRLRHNGFFVFYSFSYFGFAGIKVFSSLNLLLKAIEGRA